MGQQAYFCETDAVVPSSHPPMKVAPPEGRQIVVEAPSKSHRAHRRGHSQKPLSLYLTLAGARSDCYQVVHERAVQLGCVLGVELLQELVVAFYSFVGKWHRAVFPIYEGGSPQARLGVS